MNKKYEDKHELLVRSHFSFILCVWHQNTGSRQLTNRKNIFLQHFMFLLFRFQFLFFLFIYLFYVFPLFFGYSIRKTCILYNALLLFNIIMILVSCMRQFSVCVLCFSVVYFV